MSRNVGTDQGRTLGPILFVWAVDWRVCLRTAYDGAGGANTKGVEGGAPQLEKIAVLKRRTIPLDHYLMKGLACVCTGTGSRPFPNYYRLPIISSQTDVLPFAA